MEILIVLGAIILVTGLVILIGRALGDPQPKPQLRKFDETPADVAVLDVSNGTPVDDMEITTPVRRETLEDQEQATKQFERLRVQIEAERRP